MSYNNPGERVVPLVETFQYHDTFGPPMTSDMPAVLPVRNNNKNDNDSDEERTPILIKPTHISQPDMTPLVAEAHAQGLELGIRQATARFEEELAQERKRVADLIHEFQQQCSDYYAKVEVDLVNLALAISAKILHRESQVDPIVVAGLVKVMLERLQQKTTVVVRLRPEDAPSWKQYFRDLANVQIVEDSSLSPKACFLETELGVADMALESQLKEVEQGFFDLLARRPEAK